MHSSTGGMTNAELAPAYLIRGTFTQGSEAQAGERWVHFEDVASYYREYSC